MASQRVAFVTMSVLMIAGSCKSLSEDDIDIIGCEEEGLCTERPPVYDKYLSIIDQHMELIQKTWKPKNDEVIFNSDPTPSRNSGNNCQTYSTVIQPFVYRGNGTKLVVQSKYYEQKLTKTTCKKRHAGRNIRNLKYLEGEKCFESMGLEDLGYKGKCIPKQTTIKLYVYDIKKEQIQRVPVKIDVCCTCDIS